MRQLAMLSAVGLLVGLAVACGSSSSTTGSPIWGPCTSSTSCQSGLTCDTGDPNGQCYKSCTTNADCTGLSAAALCNTEGHCYQTCSLTPVTAASNPNGGNCPRAAEGYVCKNDGAGAADPNNYCDGP